MKRLLLLFAISAMIFGLVGSLCMAQSPWTKQTSGTTQILRGLKVVSDKVVWASGMLGVVLRTVDGGATWQTKANPGATFDVYEIEALDSLTAWAFGTDDATSLGAKIWKTTNGGTSWTEQYSNVNTFGDGIRFFDSNNGIAIGDPEPATKSKFLVLTTTNGGTTWTQVAGASIPPVDSAADEVGVTNGLELTGTIAWFVTYGNTDPIHPRVFKSTDKGLTWTASARIMVDDSYGFSMRDQNNGIMSNINSGSIARTTNGWATADSILLFNGTYGLRSVDWIPGTNSVVIVGGPTATGISGVSKDGGVTWTQRDVPAGVGRLRFVQFLDPGTGWAVGNGGAILKWTDPPLTAVENEGTALPSSYALGQNYPNPFNPTTTIEYSVAKAGSVELKVYDLLGRELVTLVQGQHNPGTYAVQFDATHLSSGVYFYTMRAGDFVSTRSLILMK
jgi:photosystem II stability/assembly factor-like uncharacterized protein